MKIKYLFFWLLFICLIIPQSSIATESVTIGVRITQIKTESISIDEDSTFSFSLTIELWNPLNTPISVQHRNIIPLFIVHISVPVAYQNRTYVSITMAPMMAIKSYEPGVSTIKQSIQMSVLNYSYSSIPNGEYIFSLNDSIYIPENNYTVSYLNGNLTKTEKGIIFSSDTIPSTWGSILYSTSFPSTTTTLISSSLGFHNLYASLMLFSAVLIKRNYRKFK